MSQHSIKGPRWEKVRQIVKNRAGGMCENDCGNEGSEADHKHPVSRGGDPYDLGNLQWLCKQCNQKKGSKLMDKNRATWRSSWWFKE